MYSLLRRELHAWFASPLAWLVLALLSGISAYLFLLSFESYLNIQEQLSQLSNPPGAMRYLLPRSLASLSMLFIAVVPLLSMSLIAGERRDGSWVLLRVAPVRPWQIVLGKYLALLILLGVFVLILSLMPLSLLLFTRVDLGALAAAMLGMYLLLASCAAIGLFTSCFGSHPLSSGMASLGILLFLWLLSFQGPEATALTRYLALPNHLTGFLSGSIDSRDVIYYLLLIGSFLGLSLLRLGRQES